MDGSAIIVEPSSSLSSLSTEPRGDVGSPYREKAGKKKMEATFFITLCLLLIFAFGISIQSCFSEQNYVSLQFWYFSSANVDQGYLGLDLSATQDNAANLSMVGQFYLFDVNQYLRFWIDPYPMSNETQWTGLMIHVEGTFLDNVNGTREFSKMYNNTIVVSPEPVQGVDRMEYFFNFSNEIQKVKEQFYPEQPLENIGIFGSLTLDITIHDIVGQVGTQRYVNLVLQTDTESPNVWPFTPSITIPEMAQWQMAKIDETDMTETYPDLQRTILMVDQGMNSHRIYATWQTSTPSSWTDLMTKFPYNLLWSIPVGILTGLVPRYFLDRRRSTKERQELKDRIGEELGIILQEVTSDCEKEAFQSRAFYTEGFNVLKQDLIRKLDAKTFRTVLDTYIKIDQLRFPVNDKEMNRAKYKEAMNLIGKTIELLK